MPQLYELLFLIFHTQIVLGTLEQNIDVVIGRKFRNG